MSWAKVKNAPVANANFVTTQTSTFASASTSGNLLILVCGLRDSGSVTLNSPTGWSLAASQTNTPTTAITYVFHKISAGDTSVTVTSTGGGNWTQHLYEFSGNASSAVVETTQGTVVNSVDTGMTLSAINTSNANDLIIAAITTDGASGLTTYGNTWTNSFTHLTEEANGGANNDWALWCAVASFVPTSTGSFSTRETWSGFHTGSGLLVAFKAGGVDTTPPQVSTIVTNGSATTITYNEPLDGNSVPSPSAYTLKVNTTPRAISTVSVNGSGGTVTLNHAAVAAGQTVTLTYSP